MVSRNLSQLVTKTSFQVCDSRSLSWFLCLDKVKLLTHLVMRCNDKNQDETPPIPVAANSRQLLQPPPLGLRCAAQCRVARAQGLLAQT